MRKILWFLGFALLGIVAIVGRSVRGSEAIAASAVAGDTTPVLVELFTSEGCSSCPPADAFLQKLDKQPFAGLTVIVLSEHVDYWNHIGWADPYSAHAYSERQSAYGRRFHLESVYTPQMIVDGSSEFVGTSTHDAQQTFARARDSQKIDVRLSNLRIDGGRLRGHIATGALPAQGHKVDVVLVVTLDHAESQVAHGENAGRRLTHVAVAKSWQRVGEVASGASFSRDIELPVEPGIDPANLRVVAFLQAPGPGRVWGAAEAKVIPGESAAQPASPSR